MRCPFCRTENRDERETCYNCEKDLSMLRLIVQKARSHFNTALEFAERERVDEAIAELNNALELDRSHVNSHIVLGTLYAKQGQMDKAVECWNEALQIDPRFLKAQEYLEKAAVGRKNLPLVRRQRLSMVVMGVFLCVLVGWLGILHWQYATRPSQARLQRAWAFYKDQDDKDALDTLRRVSQDDPDSPISAQAALLGELIHSQHQILTSRAEAALQRMDLAGANRQIALLLERNPPQPTVEKARILRARVAEASAGTIATALQMFRAGKVNEQTVRQSLNLHRQILGSAASQDDFQKSSERAYLVLSRNRKVETVVQRFREKKLDEIGLLKELMVLNRQYPDYAKLQALIQRFAEPQERVLLAHFDAGIKDADPAAAEAAMSGLRRLWGVLKPDKASSRLAAFEKNLEAARTERMLRDVRACFAAKNYGKTVEVGQSVLKQPIDETARAMVKTLLADAQGGLATERWLWMRALDRRYIDARITPEEAEQTIRCYPQVHAHLSRKTYPNVDDDMLFYLAMAYRRIGQTAKADEAFRQLVEKYPKSAFVRWVKHYQQSDTAKDGKVSGEAGSRLSKR